MGLTTVLPPMSSLPDLYLKKTCPGACQECGLKSSEYEPRSSKDLSPIWSKGKKRSGDRFLPRTRKLSPGYSRSRFLGTSTRSPQAQPVSLAASAFSVVFDTERVFAIRWKHWPSFGLFWVAPQFSFQRARFPPIPPGNVSRSMPGVWVEVLGVQTP